MTWEGAFTAYKARFAGLSSVACDWCGRVVAITKRGVPRRHGCPTPAWNAAGQVTWFSDTPTARTPCRLRQSGDGAVLSRWTDEVSASRLARRGGYIERAATLNLPTHAPGQIVEDDEYLKATVAFVLTEAMEAAGVTQRDLAARIGVTEARVSHIFNAEGNLTLRTLARIGTALGRKVSVRLVEVAPSPGEAVQIARSPEDPPSRR